MKKWLKAALFLLPLLLFIGWVNWYVDSYALLRVTYDDIAAQMEAGKMWKDWKTQTTTTGTFWRRA